MFDRMVFLGSVFNAEEMEALLTFLNDNPNVIVAFRKRKTVMLVNAEKIVVRKIAAVQKLVDSLELRNYLIKLEETPTFIVYKFRPAEVKELHDLAIALYAISNLIDTPQQGQLEPEPVVEAKPVKQKKKEAQKTDKVETADKVQKVKKAEKPQKPEKSDKPKTQKAKEIDKPVRKKVKV